MPSYEASVRSVTFGQRAIRSFAASVASMPPHSVWPKRAVLDSGVSMPIRRTFHVVSPGGAGSLSRLTAAGFCARVFEMDEGDHPERRGPAQSELRAAWTAAISEAASGSPSPVPTGISRR